MLKVALPRPSTDAVFRGDKASFTSNGPARSAWQRGVDDESPEKPLRRLTPADVQALLAADPPLSPWRVVACQVAFAAVAGFVVWLMAGPVAAASAVYGAAVVAVPGALMARGATSRLSALSPVVSAVSMMGWATVKLVVSVAMLVLAARIVPGLVWPVMLVSMVLCMQTYWFALLWRGTGEKKRAAVLPEPRNTD